LNILVFNFLNAQFSIFNAQFSMEMTHSDLLKLKRFNTPTIYNGWEQITRHDRTRGFFNLDETRDFMPQMGPMVGYAVTLVIEPSNPVHKRTNPGAVADYRAYVASVPGPKIVVVQDLDAPRVVGSFWGEVNANVHRSLGCVGAIVDGAIRDVDEMTNAGFKALARRLCVGHAYAAPVRWNCEVEAFGCRIQPGALIHADKHGFQVIPEEDQPRILQAAAFMDANECDTVIAAARDVAGKPMDEVLAALKTAGAAFRDAAAAQFGRKGEW
jgi:regulator of RNase E activity RraA